MLDYLVKLKHFSGKAPGGKKPSHLLAIPSLVYFSRYLTSIVLIGIAALQEGVTKVLIEVGRNRLVKATSFAIRREAEERYNRHAGTENIVINLNFFASFLGIRMLQTTTLVAKLDMNQSSIVDTLRKPHQFFNIIHQSFLKGPCMLGRRKAMDEARYSLSEKKKEFFASPSFDRLSRSL